MTPRTYWDAFGNLWELQPSFDLLRLVWSPHNEVVGIVVLSGESVATHLGPLVVSC